MKGNCPEEYLDIDTDLAFSEEWDEEEPASASSMTDDGAAVNPIQSEPYCPVITTYNERTLHAALKLQYESDTRYHEVPYLGYIADIKRENSIVEIQTGNFRHMKEKLAAFLPNNRVTVVYPLTEKKWIHILDPETGEFSPRRRSPKTGKIHHAFEELYQIREWLSHPNLTVIVQMMDVEEYRKKNVKYNGHRRKSLRCETVPISYGEKFVLHSVEEYLALLPELPEMFTAKMLAQVLKMDPYYAYSIIHCYEAAGLIQQVGLIGRAKAYAITQ